MRSEVRHVAQMVDAIFIGERIRSTRHQRTTFFDRDSQQSSFPARRESPDDVMYSSVPHLRSKHDMSQSSSGIRRGGVAWWFQPGKINPSHQQNRAARYPRKEHEEATRKESFVPDEELLWRSSLRQSDHARSERLPALAEKSRSSQSSNTFPRRSHRNRACQQATGAQTEHASPLPQARHASRPSRDLPLKKKSIQFPQRSISDKEGDSGAADSSSSESHGLEHEEKLVTKSHNQHDNFYGLDVTLVAALESEVISRCSDVTWESVAGLEEAKRLLQEALILPLLVPDFFTGIRRPWRGVLLVGPPGTGKTLLAKAVASECKATFFNVTAATLMSKYRGESEKLVRILFRLARRRAPSVIFFDEVEALVSQRGLPNEHEATRRFQAELLVQMDGISEATGDGESSGVVSLAAPKGPVLVLAATNHPWMIDEAFRRRFEKRIYVPLPDHVTRKALLSNALRTIHLDPNVDVDELSVLLDGYSGADIVLVARDAAMMYLRRKITGLSCEEIRRLTAEELTKPVTMEDFKEAITRCKRSVNPAELQKYERWIEEFGSA